MLNLCKKISESKLFQNSVLVVILFTAVLMGLETSSYLLIKYDKFFQIANFLIQAIFVFEISVRIFASYPRFQSFFKDGWNVFDFLVVVLSLLPESGAFAMVARLARVLRVARLLSASPELRLIIGTMLRSIPSLGNVAVLLGLLLYIYSIMGFHMFHRTDPENWGSLGKAALTLFQVLTLEGWVELQDAKIAEHPWVWLFYGSFIIIAVFVVVNLFIAVVLNNLEAAKLEMKSEKSRESRNGAVAERINSIRQQLDELERQLE